MTEPQTYTIDVPGVRLTYDVRPAAGTTEPPLVMLGSPMDASGFADLASHFTDRTVVTYDPRGTGRSEKTGAPVESTPEQHASDIHAVIEAVGGPVDIFASSGGAVNCMALIVAHPGDVRTLIAHEPPAFGLLPDGAAALAAVQAVSDTYQKHGFGTGMARFIMTSSQRGEIPADFADQPDPDPAMFGLPAEDDGSRTDALLAQNITTCTHFQPDFDALRAAPTRIVVGVGEDSAGEMAHRTGEVVAERLGQEPVTFPSHHGGFVGGHGEWAGKPAEFAAKLRETL